MDVVCSNCSTKIKIPDSKLEKIPKGQVFSINCPKCKNKISVENKPDNGESKPAKNSKPPAQAPKPATTPPPQAQQQPEDAGGDMEESSSGSPFGFLEEGTKTVLLCEPDAGNRAKINAVLKKISYQHISEPASPRDALKQMRAHEFSVVILNELFGTRDPDANHVLKYLQSLKMNIRRNMFVVLISHRLPTMDKLKAYNKSVNVIISTKNINDFEKYFTHAFNENEAFYRVFMESVKKIRG